MPSEREWNIALAIYTTVCGVVGYGVLRAVEWFFSN